MSVTLDVGTEVVPHFVQDELDFLLGRLWVVGHVTRVICSSCSEDGFTSFNDTLNTFYLWLYGITHMVKDHSDSQREESRCHHMGYSFRLAGRVLLYTYHCLCYTSRGALAGTKNSSMGPP